MQTTYYEQVSSRTRRALWLAASLKLFGLLWSLTHTAPLFSESTGTAVFLHVMLLSSLLRTLLFLDCAYDRTPCQPNDGPGTIVINLILMVVETVALLAVPITMIAEDVWPHGGAAAWCANWGLVWVFTSALLDPILVLLARLFARAREDLPPMPPSLRHALLHVLDSTRDALQRPPQPEPEEEHVPLFGTDLEAQHGSPEASQASRPTGPPPYEAPFSTSTFHPPQDKP